MSGLWVFVWLFSSSPTFNAHDPGQWGFTLIGACVIDCFLGLAVRD